MLRASSWGVMADSLLRLDRRRGEGWGEVMSSGVSGEGGYG
jgi:hypothetical protein